MANEAEYRRAIDKALEIGAQLVARSSTGSREHSLSYTKLQEAKLWSDQDQAEKEQRGQ